MKTISAFYIPSPDKKYTNFGDILTPFILSKFSINVRYEKKNPQIIGVGSLIHMLPKDTDAYLFSTGLMYPVEEYYFKKDPIALRGRLTMRQFTKNDLSNCAIGDGGLILETIYKPRIPRVKYKLGIFPNYADIVNMRDDPIEKFDIFTKNPYDVLLIDPRNYVETVLDQVYSCENIITSSLHGAVSSDSYGKNYGIFSSRETQLAIHQLQGSFKFKDYYSTFGIDFKEPDLFLDKNTSIERALAICKPVNKPTLFKIKYDLVRSIDKIKEI